MVLTAKKILVGKNEVLKSCPYRSIDFSRAGSIEEIVFTMPKHQLLCNLKVLFLIPGENITDFLFLD